MAPFLELATPLIVQERTHTPETKPSGKGYLPNNPVWNRSLSVDAGPLEADPYGPDKHVLARDRYLACAERGDRGVLPAALAEMYLLP